MTIAQNLFLLMSLLTYVLTGAFASGVAESFCDSEDIGVFFFACLILLICVAFTWVFKAGGKK